MVWVCSKYESVQKMYIDIDRYGNGGVGGCEDVSRSSGPPKEEESEKEGKSGRTGKKSAGRRRNVTCS